MCEWRVKAHVLIHCRTTLSVSSPFSPPCQCLLQTLFHVVTLSAGGTPSDAISCCYTVSWWHSFKPYFMLLHSQLVALLQTLFHVVTLSAGGTPSNPISCCYTVSWWHSFFDERSTITMARLVCGHGVTTGLSDTWE